MIKHNCTQSPLVSIIVPVYNTSSFLETCLSSISKQSYRNIEVVMVDDGSTDNSNQICQNFVSIDNRFRLYTQENGGRSAARNKGLSLATGSLIGFVDSDDWIDEDMFEVLYNASTSWNADIVQCSIFYHRKKGVKVISASQGCVLDKREGLELLFRDKYIGNYLCNKLFRRELFEDVVFPLKRNFEDIFVMYKLFARATTIVCTPAAKYHYIISPTSVNHATFRIQDKLDYLEALNSQYQFAHAAGLWKGSSVRLTKKYLNALDECIKHKVDQHYIELFSDYLRENISSFDLLKRAPYQAIRRFLFLYLRDLYVFCTR